MLAAGFVWFLDASCCCCSSVCIVSALLGLAQTQWFSPRRAWPMFPSGPHYSPIASHNWKWNQCRLELWMVHLSSTFSSIQFHRYTVVSTCIESSTAGQQHACVFRLKIDDDDAQQQLASHQGRETVQRCDRMDGWTWIFCCAGRPRAASYLISESINYDFFS